MLGIGLVPSAHSGAGSRRGALDTTDGLTQGDLRHRDPRFQGEHPERNRALVARCAGWPVSAGSHAGSSRCRGCWPRTATWSRSPARSGSNAWSPQARTARGRRREPVRRPGLSALGRGLCRRAPPATAPSSAVLRGGCAGDADGGRRARDLHERAVTADAVAADAAARRPVPGLTTYRIGRTGRGPAGIPRAPALPANAGRLEPTTLSVHRPLREPARCRPRRSQVARSGSVGAEGLALRVAKLAPFR
jgi:hypothetical protein